MLFTQPPLPYAIDALNPFLSGEQMTERSGVPISRCLQKPFPVDVLLNLVRRAGTACAE